MFSIKKAAVLGSGVMGSAIACHLANVGIDVLLLDILPRNADEDSLKSTAVRNSIAQAALKKAIKSKPAPLYHKSFQHRITVGNFDDDFKKIKEYDWIIEVVVENLDIKKKVFSQVEEYRKKGTLVSSNTSGIPIHMMLEDRSDDFKAHFLGTHFFNPPRYLKLLEIIPTAETNQEVIDFWMDFGRKRLGKESILCKDTPAFIANRIGVYAMAKIFQLTEELELDLSTVDKLTGPSLSRPKTGTFRLGDLVGMDTAIKVIKGVQQTCPDDKMVQDLVVPEAITWMLENNYLGNKTGQGFYKKTKTPEGKRNILVLNLKTKEYEEKVSSKLASLEVSKQVEDPKARIKALLKEKDKGGELIRHSLAALLSYSAQRIPEISETVYSIDNALRAGFAWKFGPFQYWDIIGLEKGIELIKQYNYVVPAWIEDMSAKGTTSFYQYNEGVKESWHPSNIGFEYISGQESIVDLDAIRHKEPVFKNSEIILHDIGDQVLCLEFVSKMNTIGEGVLKGLNKSIDIAENGDWRGLVIGNQADNFSVGANLMMIAMLAYQGEFDELNFAVNLFQQTTMRCRYSSIPVVLASQGYVFGGGCETMMHCDASVCAAESYIGLVEVGVGLIPGGGGTKEFALRLSDSFFEGDVQIPSLIKKFKTIATAQVATSAYEAYEYGYLDKYKDEVVTNTSFNIARAKDKVIQLSGLYHAANPRTDITVLGRSGMAALYAAANELKHGRWASEHDIKIAKKIAHVLCGGDLTSPQQVSEQYLLDIEREAFLSLCGEQKTLERIQHMLQKNKPLRN